MLRKQLIQPRPQVLQLAVHLQDHTQVVQTAEGQCGADLLMYRYQQNQPLWEALMWFDFHQHVISAVHF